MQITEVLLLEEHGAVSLAELAELTRWSEGELLELIDHGVITPDDPQAAKLTFGAQCIVAARTAHRLRDDFELDAQGVAVALALLDRIDALEARIRDLIAQQPRRLR
jgi:chaperone modulatory protein CbpM